MANHSIEPGAGLGGAGCGLPLPRGEHLLSLLAQAVGALLDNGRAPLPDAELERLPRPRPVMPIYHRDRLKLGIRTSPNFHEIITPPGKPSRQWREYACVLIAERLLHRKIEFYNSSAMERGLIVEAEAVDWYEFDRDGAAGWLHHRRRSYGGCSPDRLVGDEPLPHTQVEYWISGEVSERFRPQLQGQLYISQRSWVDFVSWHDVLPKLVMRVVG